MNRLRNTPLLLRECVIWALVLFLLQALSFSGVFFNREVLTPSDLLDTMAPWRDYVPKDHPGPANILMFDPLMAFRPDFLRFQEALREDRWPLWNDLEFCGLPLLANCQSRVFYPPHLSLLALDVDTAMSVFIVLKLWLAAFVGYVCARLLGFGIWPSRWYSVVWGLGCFTRVWAYWPITDVLVWVPIVFLATEWLAENRLRKGFFALSIGGVMLLFAGHPETAFAVNAYIALYFLLRIAIGWMGGPIPWRPFALYAGAWLLAIAVYAVQLLPFAEYVVHCAPVADRIRMPLTASALASFWVPRFFGTKAEGTFWEMNVYNSNLTIQQYAGIAAWFGIAFAVACVIRKSPLLGAQGRVRVVALVLSSFASLAMAMDISSLEWARQLPGFSHMRTIYHVYFSLFAVPLLGLIGLDAWFARQRQPREMLSMAIVFVAAAAIVGLSWAHNAAYITFAGFRGYVLHEIFTTVGFALVVGLAIAAHCFTKRAGWVWAILLLISICDVYWPARGLNTSVPLNNGLQITPMITLMQEKPRPCRFDVMGAAIAPGTVGNYGIEEWDGYDGLYPERPFRFRKVLSTKVWDRLVAMLGVDYFLNDPRFDEELPITKMVDRGDLAHEITVKHLDLYRHVGALPRARLVGNLETEKDVDRLFARMLEKTFDPALSAITEQPPSGAIPDNDAGSVGTARIETHEPEHVVVRCDATSDAILVLAENFYPGWEATIDGTPASVFPAYYTFRAVVVPRGQHLVEFRYRPRSLTLGLSISVVALVLSAILASAHIRRTGVRRTTMQAATPNPGSTH